MEHVWKITELLLVFVAVLIPQFLMASEVDGDEFAKATAGIALGGIVVGAYSTWKRAK